MSKYTLFFLNLPNIQSLFEELNVVADADAEVIRDDEDEEDDYEDTIGTMMEDSEYLFREKIEQYIQKTDQLTKHTDYPQILIDFRIWLHFMAHRKLSRTLKIQTIMEQMMEKRKEEYTKKIYSLKKMVTYYKEKKPIQIIRPPGYRRQKKSEKQIIREQLEEYKLLTTKRARGGLYDYEIKDYAMVLENGPLFYEAIQRFQNKYVCFNTGTCILKEFGKNRTAEQLKRNRYYECQNGKGITRLYYCSCQSSYRAAAVTITIQLSITKVKDASDLATKDDEQKNNDDDNGNETENDDTTTTTNKGNSNEVTCNNETNGNTTTNTKTAVATTSNQNDVVIGDNTFLCKFFVRKRFVDQVTNHFQVNPDLKYGPDGIELLQKRHEQLPKRATPINVLLRRLKERKQQEKENEGGDNNNNEGEEKQQHEDEAGVVQKQNGNEDPNNTDMDHHPYTTGDEGDDDEDHHGHDGDDEDDDVLEDDYVLEHGDEEMEDNDVFHRCNNHELQYY